MVDPVIGAEALYVRFDGAYELLKQREIDPLGALAFVVAPSTEVLEASLAVAEQNEPRAAAKRLAKRNSAAPSPLQTESLPSFSEVNNDLTPGAADLMWAVDDRREALLV